MDYSLSNLNDVADCNILLSWAEKQKAALNYKKITDEYSAQKFATTSQAVEEELQAVLVEITSNDIVIGSLPDGKTKNDALDKKVKLEYKKYLLEGRRDNYGVVALLQKQLDLVTVTEELVEVDGFIEVIETRKAEISGTFA